MPPTLTTFLFETANFAVLAVLLGRFFFRPLRRALEERRAAQEKAAADAADAARRLEAARSDLDRARLEFQAGLEQARKAALEEAARSAAAVIAEARAEAARARAALERELASRRDAEAGRTAQTAAAAAGRLLARTLDRLGLDGLHDALIRTACRELAGLSGAPSSGPDAPAVVEFAAELSHADRAALAAALGAPTAVEFRHEPELLAGVRITTRAGLVNASIAGLAGHAERALAVAAAETLQEADTAATSL